MDFDLREIWDEFSDSLLGFIKSKVRNQHDAEDILQEIFIKLYKNADSLEEQSKLKSWIYQITRNAIIDYYRKHKEMPSKIEELENTFKADEESENINEQVSKCLRKMMFDLPQRYYEAVELYDIKGMKHKDISKELNISLSGSKTRLQRARNMLRDIMTECCDFEFDAYGNILEYHQKKNCDC